MSEITRVSVKQKHYLDSVALMRYSQSLVGMDGISEAAMMMGTPSNIEIMQNAGLIDSTNCNAGPGDLVIAVRGANAASLDAAIANAETLLSAPKQSSDGASWRPRSIRSAIAAEPDSNLALISVPGAFAVSEARKTIRRGLHAMIFSDNVSIESEVALKQEAKQLGQLVMGPDCGTAIVNGVPLAFANSVPRGNIAIIGASGTGIQEVSCLIAQQGHGISQAIGVGGRDLHAQVGGISTLMAMEALEQDNNTQHIVLISKPPAPDVASKVLQRAGQSSKPYTICFLGGDAPQLPANCQWATSLTDAAMLAMGKTASDLSSADQSAIAATSNAALLHGYFCGGTLCTEALVFCKHAGLPVASNIKLDGLNSVTVDENAHRLIDLGADEYTQGKPHPMIEPSIRDEAVAHALQNNNVGVLLIDMVLGYGSHANPAGQFVERVGPLLGKHVDVYASVTGTDADPQQRSAQVAMLEQAGIRVYASNAIATQQALRRCSKTT